MKFCTLNSLLFQFKWPYAMGRDGTSQTEVEATSQNSNKNLLCCICWFKEKTTTKYPLDRDLSGG